MTFPQYRWGTLHLYRIVSLINRNNITVVPAKVVKDLDFDIPVAVLGVAIFLLIGVPKVEDLAVSNILGLELKAAATLGSE